MYKILLGLLFVSTNAFALDCKSPMTTADMNACAGQDLKKVEAELNAVYKDVIKSLSGKDSDYENAAEIKGKLVEAQRAWIKFREADCEAVRLQNQLGSIGGVMYMGCMQERAEQRVKELKAFGENH